MMITPMNETVKIVRQIYTNYNCKFQRLIQHNNLDKIVSLWIHFVVIHVTTTTWKVIMFLCVLIELNVFWAKFTNVIAYDLIELGKLSFITSPPPTANEIIATQQEKLYERRCEWEMRIE